MQMRPQEIEDGYKRAIAQYDDMLAYARHLSDSLVSHVPGEFHLSYAEQIFVKILVHAITLRTLAADPKKQDQLWDLSSASALARCVIEAVDVLAYISDTTLNGDERDFRHQLWRLHDLNRRCKALAAIGSTADETAKLNKASAALSTEIQAHPHFALLSNDAKGKLRGGDPPAFLQTQRERCAAAGVSYEFHTAATIQLSQYVHTLPMSIHQLFEFKAGTPEALHLMKLPINYAGIFLALAVQRMRVLFPKLVPVPSQEIEALLADRALVAAWRSAGE